MCIGKNMAMMNILKVLSTVLRNYKMEMVHPEEPVDTVSVGISEKKGGLMCRISRRWS
jgi:cytochrome P450